METTTVMIVGTVLVIFVGIPAIIALSTAIMYRVSSRRSVRTDRVKTLIQELELTESPHAQPAELSKDDEAEQEQIQKPVKVT